MGDKRWGSGGGRRVVGSRSQNTRVAGDVIGGTRAEGASWSVGYLVTDRDRAMLGWIGRHGIVTAEQAVGRFFVRPGGEVGRRAAYRRLAKLEAHGLLIRQATSLARARRVIRLTRSGARAADLHLAPARVVEPELRHSLSLVDLMDRLSDEHPGSRCRTERELRTDRIRERGMGTRRVGRGRMPDGELFLASGETIAIELDLTPKRSRIYEQIIRSYRQERFDGVWWYAPAGSVERLRGLVRDGRADDFIDVRAWVADHGLAADRWGS